jgi:hypothetical protein
MLIAAVLAISAFAETTKLYLKDGSYQLVREYQVLQDRVKYLSAERGEWEEIPLDLLDLDRTKKEAAAESETLQKEAKEQDEEDAAIRAEREVVARVPVETGVYYIHGEKLEPIKVAEVKITNDKKRSVLKVLAPIPIVPGKNTVELDGAVAQFRIEDKRPEFYFRLSSPESIALVKLSPKKNLRIVETAAVLPVSNEVLEERQAVLTFKKQIDDQLFKIWPEKPLEPGEYALIQYTESKLNPQVYDFGVGPGK